MTGLGLRPDTGSFDRFLTSLGLVLLGGAFVIPYFFFGSTETLDIPAHQLRDLSQTGKESIEGRQRGIASLEPWVLGLAVVLGVLGAYLVVVGAVRLKSAQSSDEEEAQLRKERVRLEIKGLSPEERAERVAAKAEEEAPVDVQRAPPEREPESASTGGDRPAAASPSRPPAYLTRAERQQMVRRIEAIVEDVFEDGSGGLHRLKFQVKIRSTTDAVRLDGVFESEDRRQPDVVLKTMVAFDPIALRKVARLNADELVAQLGRYQRLTQRTADGWLVAVVPRESDGEFDDSALIAGENSLADALASFGKATLVRESELDRLPRLFASNFGHTFLL